MLRSDKILQKKTLHCMEWWSSMPDVEFYRLYNDLWARGLMPCLCRVFCRDFCDFHKSLPCFSPFFAVIFYCPYICTVPEHWASLHTLPNHQFPVAAHRLLLSPVRILAHLNQRLAPETDAQVSDKIQQQHQQQSWCDWVWTLSSNDDKTWAESHESNKHNSGVSSIDSPWILDEMPS